MVYIYTHTHTQWNIIQPLKKNEDLGRCRHLAQESWDEKQETKWHVDKDGIE